MKRSDRRRHGRRYAPEFKVSALKNFETLKEKGHTSNEIAEILKVTTPSLNRWRRERNQLKASLNSQNSSTEKVNFAIEILSGGTDNILMKIEAIFTLIVWQRWPRRHDMHAPAMLALCLNYFDPQCTWQNFGDIDHRVSNLIHRNTSITYLRQLCSPLERLNESFHMEKINFKNYTERDFLAQIVAFLLLDKSAEGASRKRMSLKRAYFASQNGLFHVLHQQSPKTFGALWQSMGAASAFYYVELYHSDIDFDIDPWSKNFQSDINAIVEAPIALRTYLSRAKYVVEILKAGLDFRTRSRLAFPTFPPTLASENVRPTPFLSDLEAVMADYLNA